MLRLQQRRPEMILSWSETRLAAVPLLETEIALEDQVKVLLQKGATPVDCIKALRELHGVGLAAGKILVDGALGSEAQEANDALRKSAAEVLGECGGF
jgi:ribosomal protein L7/L12